MATAHVMPTASGRIRMVGTVSAEGWNRVGAMLAEAREEQARGGSEQMWDVGDWTVTGEDEVFRTRKKRAVRDRAATITGYSRHTLAMAASLSRKFPESRRYLEVSWWHHLAVAKLGDEDQTSWLSRAATERWSAKALREELRSAGLVAQRTAPSRLLVKHIIKLRRAELDDDVIGQLAEWWQREVLTSPR